MILHYTYARFLPKRTFKVVCIVFFGARGSHGVPPLKLKLHLLLNHDSELKKKKVDYTGNLIAYLFYFF